MARHGFPKSARLLKTSEFDRVFARRCSISDSLIVLHVAHALADEPRLGLVVSRKCGNAVKRNHWKRCLREAFRLSLQDLPAFDFVVVPRANAEPNVAELQASFRSLSQRLVRRLGLPKEPRSLEKDGA
jgi:ribonuclease P protein component